jgi:heme oxygenase
MDNTGLDSQREVMRNVSACRMTEPRSTIDLLRAQTATHHHRLESGLRIQDRLSAGETRGPLIAGYRAFYREAGLALKPHLRDVPDLAFSSRVRSRRFLREAGLPRHRTVRVNLLPAIATKAEALGVLYVLEGSTLGGRMILKTLRNQGLSTDDLHFLDPYGTATGAQWRTFLAVLERETASNQTTMNACVSGAIKAFAFAATCLREERTN